MKLLKILKRIICLLVVFSIISLIGYTYFLSPTNYAISSYQYTSSKIPSQFDHFKIALFSDCHIKTNDDIERFEKMIDDLNDKPFNMVVFGGDLFEDSIFDGENVSRILKKIDCKYGKFAVLGEKDESLSMEITKILNDGGFEVLNNQNRTIYYNQEKISLLGLDSNKKASTLTKKGNKLFNIALVHTPDSFEHNSNTVDLQLSGHSNGGYFYFPFLGGLVTSDGCETYNHGKYTQGDSTLLITNGVKGTSDLPYKFLCRNEIKLITLNYEQKV